MLKKACVLLLSIVMLISVFPFVGALEDNKIPETDNAIISETDGFCDKQIEPDDDTFTEPVVDTYSVSLNAENNEINSDSVTDEVKTLTANEEPDTSGTVNGSYIYFSVLDDPRDDVLIEEPPTEYSVLYEEKTLFYSSRLSLPAGSFRYADQLSGREVDIYNLLESDESIAKYHESNPDNSKVVIAETYTFSNSGASVSDKEIEFETYRDSVYSMIRKAMSAFDFDHPEIFWTCGISYTVAKPEITASMNSMSIEFRMQFPYCWPSERNLANDEASFNNVIDNLVSDMQTKVDTFHQLEYLHNWILTNNSYNYDANDHPVLAGYIEIRKDIEGKDTQWVVNCTPWSAAGALLNDFSPVCEGYSRAFQLICQRVGIPCAPVVGNSHMWNYVKCGEYWYAVDCTWDDTGASVGMYNYFLVGSSDNSFVSQHTSGPHYNISFAYPSIVSNTKGGACGSNTYWKILNDGCLYIYGSGAMNDYTLDSQPWYSYKGEITAISIGGDITNIGKYAFFGCGYAENVFLGEGIEIIDESAFEGCSSISTLLIPASVKSINPYAFALSKSLYSEFSVTFLGNCVDSFGTYVIKKYAFESVNGTAYYSKRNTTWTSDRINELQTSITQLDWINIPIPVEGISITNGDSAVQKGSTLQLYISFTPTDCDNNDAESDVLWSVDSNNIVSVDFYGLVTALDCGTATVKATSTENDSVYTTVTISVPHILSHVEGKEKTCTTEGVIEHWKCSGCGKSFSDESGTNPIIAVIPAGHISPVDDPAVPATFESTGLTAGSHCEKCGETIVAQVVTDILIGLAAFTPATGFDDTKPVMFDGVSYMAEKNPDGTYTVEFHEETQYSQMTTYKYNDSGVPTGMSLWILTRDDNLKYTATPVQELDDLLTYHGFSIRITGKTGIRFKTGIDVQKRAQLLTAEGLNGWQLVEYGTLNMTDYNYEKYPCVKDGEKVSSGRAYFNDSGKIYDYVLETVAGRYRYASVLTPIPIEHYKTEFVFRGYIVLTKGGQTYTFYGPVVYKSMYELAGQVMGQYALTRGAVYDYAEKIRDDADAYIA